MEFEDCYLGTKERIELIEDYILHESHKINTGRYVHAEKKIRNRIGDEHADVFLKFQADLSDDIECVRKKLSGYSLAHKWMLLHAISFGIFYKKLFCCVGWDRLNWTKRSLPSSALRFETNLNYIHAMKTEKPFFTDVVDFAKRRYAQSGDDGFLTNQDEEFAKVGAKERVNDPIICRKKKDFYLIHDGTGRMLTLCGRIVMNEIDRNTTVTAWVGKKTRFNLSDRNAYQMAKRELFRISENKKHHHD